MIEPGDQSCPVERTVAVIGGRWTVLILRDLLLRGPRRFQDFQDSLKGMAPNTLSDRLKTLETHGIVERQFYEQHPPRAEYMLTEKGRELGAIVGAMRDWGENYHE
ncbi:MAG: winged helix-turn-helix transcriptional regulator [Alphaproteobacteria bacterium]